MSSSRNIFQKIPFIRITGLFLIGILAHRYLVPQAHAVAIASTILISVLILFWYSSRYLSVKIHDIILSLTIVVLGMTYPSPERQNPPSTGQRDYYLAEVCQKPAEKAKTFQTILIIRNEKSPKPEKTIAYFAKANFDSTITTGDLLTILATPQEIKNAGNPYEFDYQLMMKQRGISRSVYLPHGNYLKTGRKTINLGNLAEKTRDYLIAKFAHILPDREERSVVSALTLGYRTEISQGTLDYFASTGAMHVLSVSGLHVALLYMILGFVLGFMKRSKSGAIAYSCIMIIFLWIYAFISGFSPPVQRATVMFTFVVIGNSIRRPVNIYNSLSASALFLVLLDPNVIFDVGFQLSYLAIFGIVLIQPVLNQSLNLVNPILKWAWSLFTVSIAAQLTTFPLGVFYFNQFSNLFWLSNFVVVPISTLIMWLTLAFFVFSPISSIAGLLGVGIQKSTWLMLASLKAMDAYPLAVSKGLVLSAWQVFIVYAIIASLIVFGFSKRKQWLFTGIALVVVFQLTQLADKVALSGQKHIYVYNTRNTIAHFINGRNNYIITNGSAISEVDMRSVQKVIAHLKLNEPVFIDLQKQEAIRYTDLAINGRNIQFINCLANFGPKSKRTGTSKISFSFPEESERSIEVTCGESNYRAKGNNPPPFDTKKMGAFHHQLE